MKHIIILTLLTALFGCSSAPPTPPEPWGAMVPVNPPEVYLSELKIISNNRT